MANPDLKPGQDCLDLVRHFEGLHDGDLRTIGLQPKRCPAGYWTEGWGHAVKDAAGRMLLATAPYTEALKHSKVATQEDADRLLQQDLEAFGAKVLALVHVRLTQQQFDALVSFTYNVGTGNLQRSTLLRKLNAGQHAEVAAEFGRWVRAGNQVLRGLVMRRKAEAFLFDGRDWRRVLKPAPKYQPRK